MKKWRWGIAAAVVLAVIVGAWGWYARPMTVTEMFPEFSWERVEWVSGMCSQTVVEDGVTKTVTARMEATPPVGETRVLAEEFAQARFSRSLLGTLQYRRDSGGTASRSAELAYFLDGFFSEGGIHLRVELFYDRLVLTYLKEDDFSTEVSYRCSLRGQEELMEQFRLLIEAYGPYQ